MTTSAPNGGQRSIAARLFKESSIVDVTVTREADGSAWLDGGDERIWFPPRPGESEAGGLARYRSVLWAMWGWGMSVA